jgi:hypothetical protein
MAVLNSFNSLWRRCDLIKLFYIWFVSLAVLFSGVSELPAQTEISKEYQVKAIFLFNFAQFVAWPTNVFSDTQTSLTIGVLGDDPFGSFLDETVQGEKVNGHPLVIQRYQRVEDVKTCQILFVSRSEYSRMVQILDILKGRNILTVGDMEGFVKSGGVVRFVTEENKIHFRISLEAAKNANLTISSKMLRLAEIVEPGKD